MTKETIFVLARVTGRPEHVETLKLLLLALVAPTREEPGCISYQLLQNRADPAEFTFLERWESQGALDAHLASPRIQQALAAASKLLAEDLDMRCYTLLA
jgi:quinol monooxygenase YgiN